MKPIPQQVGDKFLVHLSVRQSKKSGKFVICRHENAQSAVYQSKNYYKIYAYAINVKTNGEELNLVYNQSNFMDQQPVAENTVLGAIEKLKQIVPESEIVYKTDITADSEDREPDATNPEEIEAEAIESNVTKLEDTKQRRKRQIKRKFHEDCLMEPVKELKEDHGDTVKIMENLLEGISREDMFTDIKQMNLLVFYEIEHYPNAPNLIMIKKFIPRPGNNAAFLASKPFETFKQELRYPTAVIDNKETYYIVDKEQISELQNPLLSYNNIVRLFYAEMGKRLDEYWEHPLNVNESKKTTNSVETQTELNPKELNWHGLNWPETSKKLPEPKPTQKQSLVARYAEFNTFK